MHTVEIINLFEESIAIKNLFGRHLRLSNKFKCLDLFHLIVFFAL